MAITKIAPTGTSTSDVDWLAVLDASLTGEAQLSFAGSRAVTALQKLAHRWLMIFLTPVGSDVYDPNYGTEFHTVLEAAVNDEAYITNVIYSSLSAANEQLVAFQSVETGLAEGELFFTAEVDTLEFNQAEQRVDLYVKVINSLGEARVLEVPSPFKGSI